MTVEDLLARLEVDPAGVTVQDLPHNSATAGAWRVTGPGGLEAVLKHTSLDGAPMDTPWQKHWVVRMTEEHRWNYWRREALAYRDGLTEVYAEHGIDGPRCRAARIDESETVILMEWAEGALATTWPLPVYRDVALALGRAQAAVSPDQTGRWPWLSRHFLRDYSREKPVDFTRLDDDDLWAHPLAAACFPPGLREGARLMHDNRERLYRINSALPRALCHLDVWPRNLFRRPDGGFTIIDWSFVGDGAIGEDPGNLVPDSLFDYFVPAADFGTLEDLVFTGYLDGLRAGGWLGDPALVQLGMWSSAVKYDWMTAWMLAQLDDAVHNTYGGAGTVDAEFKFRERSLVTLHLTRWAEQALALADRMDL